MPGIKHLCELPAEGQTTFVLSASAEYTDQQESQSRWKDHSNLASLTKRFLNRVHIFLPLFLRNSPLPHLYLLNRTIRVKKSVTKQLFLETKQHLMPASDVHQVLCWHVSQ